MVDKIEYTPEDKLIPYNEEAVIDNEKKVQEIIDDSEKIGFDRITNEEVATVPNPNFCDCPSIGTVLPKNMANDSIRQVGLIASKYDLKEFIREKLGYASRVAVCTAFSSEQIEALALIIISHENGYGFILGDEAGTGKGRVCAGFLRYFFKKEVTPIFITQKPYLFSDIYRDFISIGGFGTDDKGKPIMPKPFILNKPDLDSSIKVADAFGVETEVTKPLPNNETSDLCKKKKLPKGFNCVFLTYSQISATRKPFKVDFLTAIADKSGFVLDESHCAASGAETKILTRIEPMVKLAKGVLFASATYAKSSAVFSLYILKTSLINISSIEEISNAIRFGKDNMAEYIANGLVKEGQMIRRQRAFSNSTITTEFVGTRNIEGSYIPDSTDNQKAVYDEAMGYFRGLQSHLRTKAATDARFNAARRTATAKGMDIDGVKVNGTSFTPVQIKKYYDTIKKYQSNKALAQEQAKARAEFINENNGKYILLDDVNPLRHYKATFRDNLYLCLKAQFCADRVIECLRTDVDYYNNDSDIKQTAPMKPLIAVRSTNESVLDDILMVGDEIDNSFAEFLRLIYKKTKTIRPIFIKIDGKLFTNPKPVTLEVDVLGSDYADGGAAVNLLFSLADNYVTAMPLSVIDYLRHRIETTMRPSGFYYGSHSLNFIMTEATGRKNYLKFNPDTGKWVYTAVEKESISQKVTNFNWGKVDVLLLNVTASTGSSAQSNPKQGTDTRPRNMFMLQFELDVNIEVQKRGRINRTGQINLPTYTYVISQIASEIRSYLMFRKKLRKLDANVSANQSASAKLINITDVNGRFVEDIFNDYGVAVFIKMMETTTVGDYLTILDSLWGVDWVKNKAVDLDAMMAFCRELEIYPCKLQQDFYDEINGLYLVHTADLKNRGEYEAELVLSDYKASLTEQSILGEFNGMGYFSQPILNSQYFIIPEKIFYSKDKMQKKLNYLAGGKAIDTNFKKIITELQATYQQYINDKLLHFPIPNQQIGEPDNLFQERFSDNQQTRANITKTFQALLDDMLDTLLLFMPMPDIIGVLQPKVVQEMGNFGICAGVSLEKTQFGYEYLPHKIKLTFLFTGGMRPSIVYSLADFTRDRIPPISKTQQFTDIEIKKVLEWNLSRSTRVKRTILTGNVIGAIDYAETLVNNINSGNAEYVKYWSGGKSDRASASLKMFTLINGSTDIGVELINVFLPRNEPTRILGNYDKLLIIDDSGVASGLLTQDKKLFNDAVKGIKSKRILIYNTKYITQRDRENNYSFNQVDKIDELNKQSGGVVFEAKKGFGEKKHIVYNFIKEQPKSVDSFGVYTLILDYKEALLFLKRLYLIYGWDYFIKDNKKDIYINPVDEAVSEKTIEIEEGEYPYEFISSGNNTAIPNVIKKTTSGVLISLPIDPVALVSYGLKPAYNFPPVLMAKMALSTLEDAFEFADELEKIAKDDDDLEVAMFVDEKLRGIAPRYAFFGDLTTSQIGELFIALSKKVDLSTLVFEEVKEDIVYQTEVTFEKAEDYLIELLK